MNIIAKIENLLSLYTLKWVCRNQDIAERRAITQKQGYVRITGLKRGKLSIGKNTFLKTPSFLECSGGIIIGEFVHFGGSLTIYSSNHNWKSTKSIPYDEEIVPKQVIIENFVWIGANVTILPGSYIEEGAIIGGGSVVSGRIKAGSIVGSPQPVLLNHRDMDIFNLLKSSGNFK